VPETGMTFGACADVGARVLDGLSVNADRARSNIAAQHGYLLSEPVMLSLASEATSCAVSSTSSPAPACCLSRTRSA